MTSKQEDLFNLDSRTKLGLVRPDLSAREAVVLIREHAPESVRGLPVFLVRIVADRALYDEDKTTKKRFFKR